MNGVILQVEVEYGPLYNKYGLGLTIWSPLGSGILTGKYSPEKIPSGPRGQIYNKEFLTKV